MDFGGRAAELRRVTPATKAVLTAFADAHRREASAREAAATATREAREAAQLQTALLGNLLDAGLHINVVVRLLDAALGRTSGPKERSRLAARLRKRRQRLRNLAGPGQKRAERRVTLTG